ncbi:MAG TPA: hypothetical protein VHE55_02505 [Fimbriimonadaceae bacterium]|nr:hypothetical protein [Fimbriimonadaceae bacterium]
MMKRATFAILAAALAFPASAQIGASGFLTYIQNGSSYDYTIHLSNTGTTSIGTLWYSWIPGADFMSATPTNISAPTGWTGQAVNGGSNDGYSIEFVANSNLLGSGQSSSSFTFTSTETPADLSANSPYSPFLPTGTSYVYEGGPFQGQFESIVINPQPAPEPLTVLALAPALLLMRRKRK